MDCIYKEVTTKNVKRPVLTEAQLQSLNSLLPTDSTTRLDPEMQATIALLTSTRQHPTENEVLYNLVKECLNSGSPIRMELMEEQKKVVEDLLAIITLSELQNTLQVDKDVSSKLMLMDIDHEKTLERARRQITPKHLEVLNILLSSHVESTCSTIIKFSFPKEEFDSIADGMLAVIQRVKMIKQSTSDKKILLSQKEMQNKVLISKVFKQKIANITQLETLIKSHRFTDKTVQQLQVLAVTMKAHLLKLKFMELDVMKRTYTPDSIAALRKINSRIDVLFQKGQSQYAHAGYQLQQYEKLGPDFEQLVSEYDQIKKDLEFSTSLKKVTHQ